MLVLGPKLLFSVKGNLHRKRFLGVIHSQEHSVLRERANTGKKVITYTLTKKKFYNERRNIIKVFHSAKLKIVSGCQLVTLVFSLQSFYNIYAMDNKDLVTPYLISLI